jgi:hypothetical protein
MCNPGNTSRNRVPCTCIEIFKLFLFFHTGYLYTRIQEPGYPVPVEFFFDLSGAKILVPHSLWTVKNDCGTPTHQTRQNGL